MRKTLAVLALTFASLCVLDAAVAVLLGWADREGSLKPLVRYFEYGRSVPGKMAQWEKNPQTPGNLYEVAWLEEGIAKSAEDFIAERRKTGPVVRSYGMSFVNNILRQAQVIDPSLVVDDHAGPAAPPNFTYAYFLDDRPNRADGDVAVLGILSSSVSAMAALSNQTWAFEQPAPFTYPIFRPGAEGAVERIDPIVRTVAQHRALVTDFELESAWTTQLWKEDAYYSPVTYGAIWLDRSPFARLVRRSLAKSHIERIDRQIIEHHRYPYGPVLRHMIRTFIKLVEDDGQIPVVILIQSRDPRDPDLLEVVGSILEEEDIPYLATAEHVDPGDLSHFLPDGHYRPYVDKRFGQTFLELIRSRGYFQAKGSE